LFDQKSGFSEPGRVRGADKRITVSLLSFCFSRRGID
jgi:hypothetical protein